MLNTYWKYAGTRYKHKFKALEASRGDVQNITWHLFDSSFENYDWTKEPVESFYDLMVIRAKQLRDTYSYLKFWFSGGSDSTTALRVFLDNNIHIDEISVFQCYTPDNHSNIEVNDYTLPYLKSIQHLIPKTKIKTYVWDYDYYNQYLGDKWLETRSNFTIRHFYFPNIKGNNYCNIVCGQEPDIEKRYGKYYTIFLDTSAYGELSGFRNIELFYTSPDLPQLHAKQSYMLKDFIKNKYTEVPKGALYKEIVRTVIRDKPVAPEPYYFRKNIGPSTGSMQWILPKDKMMLKSMSEYEKQKYRSILYSTISNTPIHRMYRGFTAHSFELSD